MQIVIIDDNKTNVLLIQHLVGKLDGCEPVTFTDSLAAMEWCASHEPDLVVVDYMMPDLDGLEFISQFRRIEGREQIPLVMVTTADLKEIRYEALQRGATDFLTKPFDTTELLARMRNLLLIRQSQKSLENRASDLSEAVVRATTQVIARENEVIHRLSRVAEYRDPETGEHILRMAHYSRLIAAALDMDDDDIEIIYRAAPMHDVGKVGIADDILLKPGGLTPEEFAVMKEHTRIGHSILDGSSSRLMQTAAEIALSHHERWDGGGYPNGLKAEAIPLSGRIVAVADVFDALTSERPYKEAWPVEKARKMIEDGAGSVFDPDVVEAFFDMFKAVMKIKERYQERPASDWTRNG
ncbi:MAG: response regulator [Rhodospirillales bacterium]|nr:response regulator [Rhodospirillales bacterium]